MKNKSESGLEMNKANRENAYSKRNTLSWM